jgi:hypothetical protein
MKRKTLYTNVDVDVEYDIQFSDLIDLISSCDEQETKTIRKTIGLDDQGVLSATNLYDEMKLEILMEAYKKYSLEELQQMLKL